MTKIKRRPCGDAEWKRKQERAFYVLFQASMILDLLNSYLQLLWLTLPQILVTAHAEFSCFRNTFTFIILVCLLICPTNEIYSSYILTRKISVANAKFLNKTNHIYGANI